MFSSKFSKNDKKSNKNRKIKTIAFSFCYFYTDLSFWLSHFYFKIVAFLVSTFCFQLDPSRAAADSFFDSVFVKFQRLFYRCESRFAHKLLNCFNIFYYFCYILVFLIFCLKNHDTTFKFFQCKTYSYLSFCSTKRSSISG